MASAMPTSAWRPRPIAGRWALEPDVDFHRRIAEATHNPLLAHIGSMLSLALRGVHPGLEPSAQHACARCSRHKAVLTALSTAMRFAARQAVLGAGHDHRRPRTGPAT